jgi:hypothetical protein
MPDRDNRSPKLFDVWRLVLVRGLFEGAFVVLALFGVFYEVGPLARFIMTVLLGGSLVELFMARRLWGHPFRSILLFVGGSGLLIGLFITYNFFFAEALVTLKLLVVMIGLWVAVRGFAALWLGLSIVVGTFERAVPVGAGLLGLALGFAALLFFTPEEPTLFVRLLSLYGLGSLGVHLAVAVRMRRQGRRYAEGDSPARSEQNGPEGRQQEARSEA